ncbi:MAG: hypothetical protein ACP5MG_09300 [Verrucomicrobiia bacterium]|jgi:hypothetical protein
MIATKKYRHLQKTLLVITALILFYTFAIYVPLCDWVESNNRPIENSWKELIKKFPLSMRDGAVDLKPLEESLREFEETRARLESLRTVVGQRTSFPPEVLEKLKQPFQLVDYQNERQLRQEELQSAASSNNVTIYPGVLVNYPEYSSDMKNPEILWAYLAMTHKALLAAINCRIVSINSLNVKPIRALAYDEKTNALPTEINFKLSISGDSRSILKFITLLPQMQSAGDSKGYPVRLSKPELYIDRVLLKKEGIDEPDMVMADLRICGFVFF